MRPINPKQCVLVLLLLLASGTILLFGQNASTQAEDKKHSQTATADDKEHAEGQRRFQQNCGRCHSAPEKLSHRITPTVLMHMRVRATLTAEDQRLILKFMAP